MSDQNNEPENNPAPPDVPKIVKATPGTALVPMKMASRGLVVRDRVELGRLAADVYNGGMIPKAFTSVPQVVTAMLTGMELGLPPLASLRVIAVINGSPSIWGKGSYALAMDHDLYERHEVTWQVNGGEETEMPPEYEELKAIPNSLRCICRTWRKGDPKPKTKKFSVNDAKIAGLWGMTSRTGEPLPWVKYWWTMLEHKATGNSMEAAIPEAFIGLVNAPREEIERQPIEENDRLTHMPTTSMAMKDYREELRDDAIDVEHKPKEKEPDPEKQPVTTVSKPKPTKEEVKATTVTNSVGAAEYEDDGTKASIPPSTTTVETEVAKPKKDKGPNNKAILDEFKGLFPYHKAIRTTKADDEIFIRCDCKAKFLVKIEGDDISFERKEAGDGSCDPKKAAPPAEEGNLQEPMPPTLSGSGKSYMDALPDENKSGVAESFKMILGRAAKATELPAKEENAYLLEMHIRQMVKIDPTNAGVLKASGMLNDARKYIDEDRQGIIRSWFNTAKK